MARPISDEELQLKKRARRRLVGAVVLVAIMAVVLPMVLDSEPEPRGQKIDIHIPSPDSGEFKPGTPAAPPASTSKMVPEAAKAEPGAAPASKAETPARVAEPAPPPASAKAAEAVPTETPAADTKDSPKQAGSAATPAKTPSSVATGAFVVQVAALSDAAKAKALEKRMSGAGLKTYTEIVSTPNGEVTRVRAGPYATRDAAEKARAQLKKAGLDGKVVPK